MSTIKRNLFANFLGSGWTVLLGLAVLPIVLKLMGVEAYGLVGVFATLLSLLSPLEAGLSTALSRELARRSTQEPSRSGMGDVVRTLEVTHWSFAVVCGALVAAVAPLIAHHWVRPQHLTPDTVGLAILIMGLVVVFQWPLSLYSGGLAGLQRQVLLNVLNGIMGTVRSLGSVAVLYFVSPTIVAYFTWQIVASALHTFAAAICLWKSIRDTEQPRFRLEILRSLRRFLVGMSGTSLALLCLTQMDKAILSRILPLEMFGYYALAAGVAGNLLRLVSPVQQAVFPRFSALAAAGDENALATLYHQVAQLLAIITIPLATTIIFFSRETLFVWTGSPTTADRTALILSLLMGGTLINALLYPPYTLQIAYGWTRLIFTTTFCATLLLVPALIALTFLFGAPGAATVWLLLNLIFVVVLVPLMHRRLLSAEMRPWFINDFALPLGVAVVISGTSRLLLPEHLSRLSLFIAVAVVAFLTLIGTALAVGQARGIAFSILGRLFRQYQHT